MTIYDFESKYERLSKEEVFELYKELDINEKEAITGNSLLHIAASYADSKAIEYLLSQGLDANIENSYGQRPLHLLPKEIRYYDKEGDEIRKSTTMLLDAKASTMRKDDQGKTAVIEAAYAGCYEMLEVIIEKGAKITMTDPNGNTALHVACMNVRRVSGAEEKYYKTVQLLLDAGLDPDAKNNYDQTAGDLAIERGDKKISAILSGLDADDPSNRTGGMTIFKAIEKKDYEAVKANIELGTDVNMPSDEKGNFHGMMPLEMACYLLDLESVKILLENGADVNHKNSNGGTALNRWMVYLGDFIFSFEKLNDNIPQQIFDLLLKHGLNIDDIIDENGNTALIKAAQNIDKSQKINGESLRGIVMKLLLKNNCDVNLSNLDGQTALMHLCKSSAKESDNLRIEVLEMEAAVDAIDKYGNTPLIYAAQNREKLLSKEISELLFDFGDPLLEHVNNEGKSAMAIASENNNEELVKLLLMKG